MQDLYVSNEGISYLRQCLERFNGSTGYLLLFFASLLFILIKGTDREKKIFIPMSLLMILTVYNPLFPMALDFITHVDNEYYRFFWMSPVVILVPYVVTKLILAILENKIQHKWTVSILALLIIVFSSKSLWMSGMRLPENKYKVPNEMIEVSEIIHNDSKYDYPKTFLEFDYNMQMRQYDARMLLTIDREDYIYAMSNDYTWEMIESDEFPQYRILAALFRYQNVDTNRLIQAFEQTKTEYVVLTTGSTMIPVLKEAGLSEVAQTAHHTILKYKVIEEQPFELVDYTECYENGW